jgi:hypothetical protein
MFNTIKSNRLKSMRSSFSSVSVSSDPDTPGIPKYNEESQNDSFQENKNACFEDKYVISETILGEVINSFKLMNFIGLFMCC